MVLISLVFVCVQSEYIACDVVEVSATICPCILAHAGVRFTKRSYICKVKYARK